MAETDAIRDARRHMEICNACRYCEGFCAVFPAMELRRAFTEADLTYLANLCHDCRACYYACQYAPPHEWGVNVPRGFAQVRAESYERFAWPNTLGRLFRRNGLVVSLATALALTAVLGLATGLISDASLYAPHPMRPDAFYKLIPLPLMQAVGLATFLFSLLALAMSAVRFWQDSGSRERASMGAIVAALRDVLSLRNLGGGGRGCNDGSERFSMARRWLHHAMFYGFFMCFAATCVGFFYHSVLDWPAPYPFVSAPVLLGTAGGVALMAGTSGLFSIKLVADPGPSPRERVGPDIALLLLLFLTAGTGLALLGLRETIGMGIALSVHLGFVLALFVLLPFSKMAHSVYRSAALLRAALEHRASSGGEETHQADYSTVRSGDI